MLRENFLLLLLNFFHSSSFDELVTTGGAVRRNIKISRRSDPAERLAVPPPKFDIKFPKCSTPGCKRVRKYVKVGVCLLLEMAFGSFQFH